MEILFQILTPRFVSLYNIVVYSYSALIKNNNVCVHDAFIIKYSLIHVVKQLHNVFVVTLTSLTFTFIVFLLSVFCGECNRCMNYLFL